MRQDGGFHGRPGKPSDTCYSFWVGATLELLEFFDFSDAEQNKTFILNTQDMIIGGLAKFENARPDPLHTYLGRHKMRLCFTTANNFACKYICYLIRAYFTRDFRFAYNNAENMVLFSIGLCGLSLLGQPGLCTINPELNISQRAYEHLQQIHKKWRNE
jgi:geranylgeranyl transferase type-1 subunit beta